MEPRDEPLEPTLQNAPEPRPTGEAATESAETEALTLPETIARNTPRLDEEDEG